jgi:D-alanine--poly(phosphoribitol) ligase subunit 2
VVQINREKDRENVKSALAAGAIRERALRILSEITSSRDVLTQPNLPLYDSGTLDSLGTVSLMLAFDEEFGVSISPADFDREAWATPEKLVADILERTGAATTSTRVS